MLLDVTNVTVQPGFTLFLEFENGERRSFNMSAYIDQKPWIRLKSGNLFQGAFVENGTVAWPCDIDIAPETLYEKSKGHPVCLKQEQPPTHRPSPCPQLTEDATLKTPSLRRRWGFSCLRVSGYAQS
jgi:hypothetical protein